MITVEKFKQRKRLTAVEKGRVRRWLGWFEGSSNFCPFTETKTEVLECGMGMGFRNNPVCRAWFPRIRKNGGCPCSSYFRSTVVKYAREMVK
jgi:hypothetical protein